MVEAIEREAARAEAMEALVQEALAGDRAIDATGEVYAAAEVHAWLSSLARGTRRPRPCRR